mgnify:CR=1 FL=1
MTTTEKVFLQQVEANIGIIRKVIHLYVDHPDDRRDLQQEILYQAWLSFPAFNGLSKFSTWLYRISLNTVLTFRHRESKTTVVGLEPALDLSAPGDENAEQMERLYQAIRQLPEAERAIIVLHLDGYSNDEVADIAGLSKNNVAVKLHRIKNELSNRLKS